MSYTTSALDWFNQLKMKIKNLSKTLTRFYCDGNQITKIEKLPDTLTTFHCGGNQIPKIENLPRALTSFDCNDNRIKIENLPPGLIISNHSGIPLTYIDNIPIEWWEQRGGFDYKKNDLLKRLQRRIRIRIRLRIEHAKARVIQNACHNWLWKTELVPVLYDTI